MYFIIVIFIGQLFPMMMGIGTPPAANSSRAVIAPWSREANLVGFTDDELMYWANVCFHICTGLFSYLNGISIPWRVSIFLHHCSRRSDAPGCDFYGRDTEAIWFHIPSRWRATIAFFLCASVFFHFATQITRFIWSDYEGSNDPADGLVPVNVTFVLSIVFAICGGISQARQEKKLMALNPERYPPGIDKIVKDVLGKVRRGELRLCSLKTVRELMRMTKEEKQKFHIASQVKRMKTTVVRGAK